MSQIVTRGAATNLGLPSAGREKTGVQTPPVLRAEGVWKASIAEFLAACAIAWQNGYPSSVSLTNSGCASSLPQRLRTAPEKSHAINWKYMSNATAALASLRRCLTSCSHSPFQSTVINWMTSIAEAPSAESWRCAVLGEGVSNRVIWSERSANQSQDSLRVSNALGSSPRLSNISSMLDFGKDASLRTTSSWRLRSYSSSNHMPRSRATMVATSTRFAIRPSSMYASGELPFNASRGGSATLVRRAQSRQTTSQAQH